MGIDEEMRDRGILYLERMFDVVEESMYKFRRGVCKNERHQGKEDFYGGFCHFCGGNPLSAKSEEPTSKDRERGLKIARERLISRLRPLTL